MLVDETYILEHISYCPLSGNFYAKKDYGKGNRRKLKGDQIGWLNDQGYILLSCPKINGKRGHIKAHRVAWFLSYGMWPTMLDHINRVKDDNRICNLRETTYMDNALNTDQHINSRKIWVEGGNWCTGNKRNGRRTFSIRKYGYEEAKRLAEEVLTQTRF